MGGAGGLVLYGVAVISVAADSGRLAWWFAAGLVGGLGFWIVILLDLRCEFWWVVWVVWSQFGWVAACASFGDLVTVDLSGVLELDFGGGFWVLVGGLLVVWVVCLLHFPDLGVSCGV